MSGPRHIKFCLCVSLQKYLKETAFRSDVYFHLSQKMTIVIVTDDNILLLIGHYLIGHYLETNYNSDSLSDLIFSLHA